VRGEGARAWASVLEEKLHEREAQLQFAEGEARRWREAAEEARSSAAVAGEQHAHECAALRRRAQQAEARLAQAPGAEEFRSLRTEVEALRALEYGATCDEVPEEARPSPVAEVGLESPVDAIIARGLALEGVRQLAVRKLRRLETECTRLRASVEQLRASKEEAELRAQTLEDRARELQGTVEQLERESEVRLQGTPGPAGEFGGDSGSGEALAALLHGDLGATTPRPDAAAGSPPTGVSDAAGVEGGSDGAHTPSASTPCCGSDTASSLSRILMAQRDRLRGQVRELESEVVEARRKVEAAERAREEVEQDNVRLYKKLKYVQAYREESVSAGGSRGGQEGGSVVSKYQRIYAAHADPFATFSKQERQRQYASLNLAEKLTLRCARSVLSSRVGRHLVFAYALILHLMVFAMMTHVTHGPTPCPVHARQSYTTVDRGV